MIDTPSILALVLKSQHDSFRSKLSRLRESRYARPVGRTVPHPATRRLLGSNAKRLLARYTIKAVARDLRMSEETIYRIFDGVRGANVDTVGRLAEYLDVPVAEFFRPLPRSRQKK